jgi:hypothetical protein
METFFHDSLSVVDMRASVRWRTLRMAFSAHEEVKQAPVRTNAVSSIERRVASFR